MTDSPEYSILLRRVLARFVRALDAGTDGCRDANRCCRLLDLRWGFDGWPIARSFRRKRRRLLRRTNQLGTGR